MTIVSIHQPNYLPWLGYFRKIAQSDVFVFYDNVQMPMGKSLVTRNRFKSPQGLNWLTVPSSKSGTPGLISETPVVPGNWPNKHLNSLKNWYAGCECLDEISDILLQAFNRPERMISDFNISLIVSLCKFVGIRDTDFVISSQMAHGSFGSDSIQPILTELGASEYLTGQGAGSMRHLDTERLSECGIETKFLSTEFSEYPQKHGSFEPGLSAIDALLNIGPLEFRKLL
jgi:hypothetical protein